MNPWKLEMAEMTLPQIQGELRDSIKSAAYIAALLDLVAAGDVVDEHMVCILRYKQVYWSLRKGAFAAEERDRIKAAYTLSGVTAH
jgi:hypothetical protein